ncbi:MAG: hypothetical protein HN623_10845 [Bdellovibrionales bacterium]|nr:hypothetical protein [Bdellovibrionales bacterium]
MPDFVSGYSVVDGRPERQSPYPKLSLGKLMAAGWAMDHPGYAEALMKGEKVTQEHLRMAMRVGISHLSRLTDLWWASRPVKSDEGGVPLIYKKDDDAYYGEYIRYLDNSFRIVTPTISEKGLNWVRSTLDDRRLAIGYNSNQTILEKEVDGQFAYNLMMEKVIAKIRAGYPFSGTLSFDSLDPQERSQWLVQFPGPQEMTLAWKEMEMGGMLLAMADNLRKYHRDNLTWTSNLRNKESSQITQCCGLRVSAVMHGLGVVFSIRPDKLRVTLDDSHGYKWEVWNFMPGWPVRQTGDNSYVDRVVRLVDWLTARTLAEIQENDLSKLDGRALGLQLTERGTMVPVIRRVKINRVGLRPYNLDRSSTVSTDVVCSRDWENSGYNAGMYLEAQKLLGEMRESEVAREILS